VSSVADATRSGHSTWRPVASYALGVWIGLTAWAALAQYVLPGRGHALGKLGSFHWVLLIDVFPALLCAFGLAVGLAVARPRTPGVPASWRLALLSGMVFPLTVRLLRPMFDLLGAGMIPALVWCVLGSAGAGWLLAGRERSPARSGH
jgi:hypothetical protein